MSKVTLKIEIDEEDFKSTEYATLLYHLNATPLAECDDAVSRQAVLKINENHNGKMPNHINFEIWNEIKALPPVLPKREQGEWCKQNDDYFDWYECSECGYGSEGEMQYSSEHDVRTKYCPNCGAEMR